jgi:hypothetical protein
LLSDIGFPCADDTAAFIAPDIHDAEYAAAYCSQASNPALTVITAVVETFEKLTTEHRNDIDEIDAVFHQVAQTLVPIPFEPRGKR